MRVLEILLPLFSVATIGVGVCFLWSWPAALVVVGGLLWVDGYMPDGSGRQRRR